MKAPTLRCWLGALRSCLKVFEVSACFADLLADRVPGVGGVSGDFVNWECSVWFRGFGGANCFFLVFAFQIPFLLAGGGGGL